MNAIHTTTAQDGYTIEPDSFRLAMVPGIQAAARRITEEYDPGTPVHEFAAGVDAALSWLDAEVQAGLLVEELQSRLPGSAYSLTPANA